MQYIEVLQLKEKSKQLKFKIVKTTAAKNYTKAEVKILKDMSLSDEQVATMVNRSRQAIYCKRWTLKLYGKKSKRNKPLVEALVSQVKPERPIEVKTMVDHIIKTKQFKKLVVGNITIDLENQVVTIAM